MIEFKNTNYRHISKRNIWKYTLSISIFIVLFIPFLLKWEYFMSLGTEILILGLFATSLNLLVGYTALISFGHAAFLGIGAYTFGILLQKTAIPFPVILFVALICSTLAGLIIGYISTRITDIYFAFLTLAFSELVYVIIVKWDRLTGGHIGLVGGLPIPPVIQSVHGFYLFTLIVVLVSFWLMRIILNSPFGWILRAISNNPERTTFVGINIRFYKIIIFIISAGFAGLAGVLLAIFTRGVFPDFASFWKCSEAFFMLLAGGMSNFWGPLLGSIMFKYLKSVISQYVLYWEMILGVFLIVLCIFFRKGLLPSIQTFFNELQNSILKKFLKEKVKV